LKSKKGKYECLIRLLFPLFLSLAFPVYAVATQDSPYLTFLLEKAHQEELSKNRYWHTLVHYKKTPLGIRSLIDDPNFFLAEGGKYDPEAELEATIRALFQESDNSKGHPACKFIARFTWIKETLNIDVTKLPVPECLHFKQLMDQIKPKSATLIFPTSHMNSPASMFGHTLLTIETADKSNLLSYAINYSAVTTDTFGPSFAIKGLLGFYRGYFSILPYYAKLQEYSDVDHRDIWEYPLNLNEEEVKRLLMHVYELDFIYSDYYFFDENCSYDLLFLLDTARPSLNLTDQCNWWVIPLDTIKTVKKNGLITETTYRPSKTTKIKHLASLISGKGRDAALSIVKGDMEPSQLSEQEMSNDERRGICDLAIEFLQYHYTKKELGKDAYQDRFLKTLQARSLLGGDDVNRYDIPAPPQPDEGHDSNRLGIGVGIMDDDLFQEFRYRPAYHDLLDNWKGFGEGSQIIFADTALRYYYTDERFKLEYLDMIDIVSLTPRSDFFHPISWKIKTGLLQKTDGDGEEHMVYELNPGGGFAYKNDYLGLWYIMMETDLNLGDSLEKRYSAGIGASIGLTKRLTDFWKIHFFIRNINYEVGDRHNDFEARLQQSFILTTNTSITIDISRSKTHGFYQSEANLCWNLFF